MEEYANYGENETTESELSDEESPEAGFMKGYHDEDETKECAECGDVIRDETHIVKEIDGVTYTFCSKACATEYEEGAP